MNRLRRTLSRDREERQRLERERLQQQQQQQQWRLQQRLCGRPKIVELSEDAYLRTALAVDGYRLGTTVGHGSYSKVRLAHRSLPDNKVARVACKVRLFYLRSISSFFDRNARHTRATIVGGCVYTFSSDIRLLSIVTKKYFPVFCVTLITAQQNVTKKKNPVQRPDRDRFMFQARRLTI